MTTETATYNIPDNTQTSLTLHGAARLTAAGLWYLVFALWLVYLILGYQFAALTVPRDTCQLFLPQVGAQAVDLCITLRLIADVLGQLVFGGAAVLLFIRKPNELMTVVGSAVLLFLSAAIGNGTFSFFGYPATFPAAKFALGFGLWSSAVFFLLFPDGRFNPRWMGLIGVLHGLWILSWWLIPALDITRSLGLVAFIILALSLAPVVIAVGFGYHRFFSPTQQQQTKWVVLGLAATLIVYLVFAIVPMLTLRSLGYSSVSYVVLQVSVYGRWAAVALIPIAIVLSIARYRLWDVDLVINRAVVSGAVTLVLALVFVAALLAIQWVGSTLLGSDQSSLAVAVASLAVAVLFNPVRNALRTEIDRRFYPGSLKVARQQTERGSITQPQTSTVAHDQVSGMTFGQYEIQELIGRGGMAEVYKARHKTMNRIVAVKVLTPSLSQDERFRARFSREARMVAELHHPNIVTVYDAGEANGTFYMAMEYIHGENVAAYLKREGRMAPELTLPILRGVASALDYAHEHGVIHRDVKPHNIMLQPLETPPAEGIPFRPVLMDFGIARLLAAHTALTSGSGALGTLDYISPEQILETSQVDRRADVYSLGVVAFQMLVGRLPFAEESPAAVIMSHLQKPAPDPRTLNPDVPVRAALAILRALAKDPDARPQTAGEFAETLE